jgi:hypothetical protein
MVTNEQLYLMIMIPIVFNTAFVALLIHFMDAKSRRSKRQTIKTAR